MAQQYLAIEGHGPPGKNTVGSVGQEYVDLDNGVLYECTEAFIHKGYKFSRELYTWERKGVDMDIIATDQEVKVAIDNLRNEISTGGEGIGIFVELVD